MRRKEARAEKEAEKEAAILRKRAAHVRDAPLTIEDKRINFGIYKQFCETSQVLPDPRFEVIFQWRPLVNLDFVASVHGADAVAPLEALFDMHLRGDVGEICDETWADQMKATRRKTASMLMSEFKLGARRVWAISVFPDGMDSLATAYSTLTLPEDY